MKVCAKCSAEKDESEYFRRGQGHQSWCKICAIAQKRDWIAENRDKVRWNSLWTKFRMRPEDWDRFWNEQDGLCAVCRLSEPTHVDHDHSCCKTTPACGNCNRGLLCSRCNLFVGFIELTPHILSHTISYLSPREQAV